MSDEAGCGMLILGVIVGFVLTCMGTAVVDMNTYKNSTVPFIKLYAEARVLEVPATVDSEGRIWLWNAQLEIASQISREDLAKLIKKKGKS